MKKWLVAGVLSCVPALAMAQSIPVRDQDHRCGNHRGNSRQMWRPTQVEHQSAYVGSSISTAASQVWSVARPLKCRLRVDLHFGPNKLMQRIQLEDGIVVRIESLGYGY